jgi:hypothetical protein
VIKAVQVTPVIKQENAVKSIKSDKEEATPQSVKKVGVATEIPISKSNTKPTKGVAVDDKLWNDLLTQLKKKYNTLYGIVKTAEPSLTDDTTLNLGFAFEFHRKRLAEASNQQIVRDILKELTNEDMSITCYLDKFKPSQYIKSLLNPLQRPIRQI